MRQTTNEEKIQNILIARAMLDDIPNNRIARDLCEWSTKGDDDGTNHHCGAAMCFGGWIAVHPYFRNKYGIRAARNTYETMVGAPRTRHEIDPDVISMRLFGVRDAFYTNETHYSAGGRRSDRTVIKDRLRTALDRLTK